jgi:allantoate deiminase
LLLGSHLDSVPNGGRFDGPLGVLAALEVLRTVQEAGVSLPVNLEAIDFTDEEGTLVGELGSGALAGVLTAEDLDSPRSGRAALEAGLARAGLTREGVLEAQRDPASLAGYLELHIEQGARLEDTGVDIGVVSSIVGIGAAWLTFCGRADHAGTTPLAERQDAAQGASAFTLATHEIAASFAGCTVNVGEMRFAPGVFNIVPAQVRLGLEYRGPDPVLMERLAAALLARARSEAERFGLGLEVELLGRVEPALMSEQVREAFAAAAEALGLTHSSLVSFAGHDGQALAAVCPTGMIFVPSAGGASHSPREFTGWEDCVNGANVLLQAALRFANS